MGKIKRLFSWLVLLPMLICCGVVLAACGGDNGGGSASGEVTLKTVIINCKGQIDYLDNGGYTREWTMSRGTESISSNFFVRSGYEISHIGLTAEYDGGSQSIDYECYVENEHVDKYTYQNKGEQLVEVRYYFPDCLHNYTIYVDANTCQGYSTNITIEKGLNVKVARSTAAYLPNQNYFSLSGLVGNLQDLASNNYCFNGCYGETLFLFSETQLPLAAGEQSITRLKYFNDDYFYQINGRDHYVYAVPFLMEDYSVYYGKSELEIAYPDVMALRVTDRTNVTDTDSDTMQAYAPQATRSDESQMYKIADDVQEYYSIPKNNDAFRTNIYYIYARGDGSYCERNTNVTGNEHLLANISYEIDKDDPTKLSNFYKAMQSTTLFLRVKEADKDRITLTFQWEEQGSKESCTVPLSSLSWKRMDCFNVNNLSESTSQAYGYILDRPTMQSVLGSFPAARIVDLIMDFDQSFADQHTDVTITGDFYSDASVEMVVLDSSNQPVDGAVLYARRQDYTIFETSLLRSALTDNKLQLRLDLTCGDYTSVRVLLDGTELSSAGGITQTIGVQNYFVYQFSASDIAKIAARGHVEIMVACRKKFTKSLTVRGLPTPHNKAGLVEYAMLDNHGNPQTFSDYCGVKDVVIHNGETGMIYAYRSTFADEKDLFNITSYHLEMTGTNESVVSTITVAQFTQVKDLFDNPLNGELNNLYYLVLEEHDFSVYTNCTYAWVLNR